MFIKVDESGNILNHWDHADEELGIITEILDPPINAGGFPCLVNSNGDYIYKYINGALVALSEQEILAHPNYKTRKLNELKQQIKQAISVLDELKAHSLAAKKMEGSQLSQEDQTFLTNFISQRDSLLAQYEVDKAQYE